MGNDENKNEEEQEEGKEIFLTRKMAMYIICGALLGVLIILCIFRGCSISKATKNVQITQVDKTEQNSGVEIATEGSLDSTKNAENATENSVPATVAPQENSADFSDDLDSDVSETVENMPEITGAEASKEDFTKSGMSLSECNDPTFGKVQNASATVIEKTVLECDTSYIYRVTLKSEAIGEYYYFCPRKTYDNLVVDDFVTVEYQIGEDSKISVCSITK